MQYFMSWTHPATGQDLAASILQRETFFGSVGIMQSSMVVIDVMQRVVDLLLTI